MVDKPVLVTSFTEFERAYGGLEDVGDDRQLPGLRRPGVLRQRRPPALRQPGVLVRHQGRRGRAPGHRCRCQLRQAASLEPPRPWPPGGRAGPGRRGRPSAIQVGFTAQQEPAGRQRTARGWARARRWRSSTTRKDPRGHEPPTKPVAANGPDRRPTGQGNTAAAGKDRRRHRAAARREGAVPHHAGRDRGHGHDPRRLVQRARAAAAMHPRAISRCLGPTQPTDDRSAWSGSTGPATAPARGTPRPPPWQLLDGSALA